MINRHMPITLAALSAALLFNSPLHASDDAMVDTLMQLRSEVQALHTQIEDNRDRYKMQIKSYALQKSDLEAQMNRKTTRLKELERDIGSVREEIKKASEMTKDLEPLLLDAVGKLKTLVKEGIPFKTEARLADLEHIEADIMNKTATPEQSFSKIWSSYEDALRMTHENGVFKQVVVINGTEELAEVAKIGTVMLFFRTPDGEVGYAEKENGEWHYVKAVNNERIREINALFTAMKKQIRVGYFTVPNAISVPENNQ